MPSLFSEKIADHVAFVTLFSYHDLRRWLSFSDFACKMVRAISLHLESLASEIGTLLCE